MQTPCVMPWSTPAIADAVATGLSARARADDAEQAVYGFDHLDEVALHPLIHTALRAAGFGVWPEQRYPGHWHKSRRSEGWRCDVVLTPGGLPLRDLDVRRTLFDQAPACDPEAAYWLEIKTVAQFEIDGPFRRYTSELLSPVAQDVKKIWSDTLIHHGGLLLLLFTANEETAEHDMATWHSRCLDRGYPVGAPARRGLPITDRIGNGYCAIGVFGVRGG